MRSRRLWVLVMVLVTGAVMASALGRAHAWRAPETRLPGVCDRGVVPFCADPAWPDRPAGK